MQANDLAADAAVSSFPAPAPASTAARVLVDCVLRSDALAKPGGDTVQVREYSRHLTEWGVDVREIPFRPDLQFRPGAIVHVFNVDRPYEFLLACRAARGHRIVVSPIHHAAARVRLMRAADSGRGMVSLSARLLPEAPREWLATLVRAVRGTSSRGNSTRAAVPVVRLLPAVPRIWRAVGKALDRCDSVALLAEGEGADLAALTGWQQTNASLVPNGRPEDLNRARHSWADRARGSILAVGRIEPRKRQLEVAAAAARLDVPVVFVGAAADSNSAYARDFADLAARSEAVEWIGQKDRDAVLELFGRSRVLLNASWVEVQSLVDLEAATLGCAVVTSPTGHSREWLGESITVVEGDDCEELLRAASAVAEDDGYAVESPQYTWTWRDAAERLLSIYEGGRPAAG